MIASELAKLDAHRSGSAQVCALTQAEAAEQMQVSRRSVQAARQVQEHAPDLAAKVKSGELKVSKAASMARERSRLAQPATDPDRTPVMLSEAGEEAWLDPVAPMGDVLDAARSMGDDDLAPYRVADGPSKARPAGAWLLDGV